MFGFGVARSVFLLVFLVDGLALCFPAGGVVWLSTLLPAVLLFTGFGMLFYSASLYEFLQEFRHGPQHEKPLIENRQEAQHGTRNGKLKNTVQKNSTQHEPITDMRSVNTWP